MTLVLHLAITLENGYFKTSVGIFLKHAICFYCQILLTVDTQNNKNNMEILGYFEKN